ncbi:MAG: glycosyltransferase [Gemmatimonadetes bacterium]|nr:glycosyltransferase [Gemmatimonadota bacterium]
MTSRRVAIVVPVRNERDAVEPLFGKFAAALTEIGDGVTIFVVDGLSTDGTLDEVRRVAARLPVEIVRLKENVGLGGAIDVGLRKGLALADAIVTLDGDDSHDPRAIPALLTRLDEGYDVVVASRFAPGGKEVGVAPHRRLMSHAAGALLRLLFPMGEVRDYSSGFRAYRSSALERVRDAYGGLVDEQGFSCMLELLLRLRSQGARAAEVPLVLRYDLKRSESKMEVGRTILRYFRLIGRHFGSPRRIPESVNAAGG